MRGMSSASITTYTCCWLPAVMLDKDQTAILLISFFEWVSSAEKCDNALQFKTTYICSLVPVTIFPTALRAAVCISTSLWVSNWTKFGTNMLSITNCLWSLSSSAR
jgi:hypothetical protein